MKYVVVIANYQDQNHADAITLLLNEYAMDPMGSGKPLSDFVKENLTKELAKRSSAFSLLVFYGDEPVGLANCFEAFSSFSCKPLINIHDFVASTNHRGKGISQLLLNEIEVIAKEKACCKITLEVLSNNNVAKNAYRKFGFAGYELLESAGTALFWQKEL